MEHCAYDELYLPLAQRVMGDMYDYAVNTLNIAIEAFHKLFIVSGMGHQFEIGNPTYIAGKNGCEVAREVIASCSDRSIHSEDVMYVDKSREFWIGWSLAYYQWISDRSFEEINCHVPIEAMYGMYDTLHEADVSLYVEIMNEKCAVEKEASTLKRLRQYAELSQRALAERSGVPLRQIQLFEQGQRDITRTQGQTLYQLSKALGCSIEELVRNQ
ncbi:helix-turn-helix domain-containing protein [Butyrivibrio sp. FCS014]|uniref:helix-turn-helix domain-containing protein n=1 Tax=Butyrivibrio sp. FCS014 TaxID=1408304 RepID=UPI000462FE73|nr:helix-turn-helix transcriptional regulator [Butyrivibrio sp. FCS014]